MLSEVLGISCEFYEKPEGYIDYRHYICQNSKRRKKTIPQNFVSFDIIIMYYIEYNFNSLNNIFFNFTDGSGRK